MPPEAIAAALLSALINAGWNAALRSGSDRLVDVGAMGIGGIAFGVLLLAWRGVPEPSSWTYLALSAPAHFAYWVSLDRAYSSGELSHVYTLARGLAPALVLVGAVLAIGEPWTSTGVMGIVLVCTGVLSVGFSAGASLVATAWAAITSVAIAAYSLIDALGARASGDAVAYLGALSLSMFIPITLYCVVRRSPARIRAAMRERWTAMLAAGALGNLGFGLVLWAQTIAPVAYVTALRETSVLFGAAIAAFLLKESVTRRRWWGALLVAIGATSIAMASHGLER